MTRVTMGDNVRIKKTPLTEQLGLAGRTGACSGRTIPSSSGVRDIIGELKEDYAVAVMFPDLESCWFAEELVEFIDHAPGSVIEIANKRFKRTETGEWIEE